MSVSRDVEMLFPEGMVGCPEWRRFSLTPDSDGGPVLLLQSLDDPQVSLLVSDPALFCPEYRPQLADEDLAALGLVGSAAAAVYCVLTVHQNPLSITANLLGPIVANPENGSARQVVLADSSYPTRYPVVGSAAAAEPTPRRSKTSTGRSTSSAGQR
jgi:flagellar assembly factor FliW